MYTRCLVTASLFFLDPSMAGLKAELFQEVAEESAPKGNNKVTVVGIGAVGRYFLDTSRY